MRNPFRYFNSSPEVIRLTVMMYIRYLLSPRQVEDGIVRLTGLELADQRLSRLSRGKLTPFSERSSAVLLENIAAVAGR
jgi:hypothetical protein